MYMIRDGVRTKTRADKPALKAAKSPIMVAVASWATMRTIESMIRRLLESHTSSQG